MLDTLDSPRRMWRVRNSKYVAFSLSPEGATVIKHLHWDKMRYARITDVIQMWPDKIELGKLYRWYE